MGALSFLKYLASLRMSSTQIYTHSPLHLPSPPFSLSVSLGLSLSHFLTFSPENKKNLKLIIKRGLSTTLVPLRSCWPRLATKFFGVFNSFLSYFISRTMDSLQAPAKLCE